MEKWLKKTKPIILFDVDKTLINTKKLFHELIVAQILDILQIGLEEYSKREQTYQSTLEKYTDFNPVALLKSVAQTDDVEQLAKDTVFNPQFHQAAIFEDVFSTLETLQTSYQLGIFSEAVKSWQETKLSLSGLAIFFDPELTFILRRKTVQEELDLLPPDCFIIDDNPLVIRDLEKYGKFLPIWLNRVNSKESVSSPTITSLNQLPSLLTKFTRNNDK